MPDPSAAGAQPSGEASVSLLAAESHSVIGSGSTRRPLRSNWLALT